MAAGGTGIRWGHKMPPDPHTRTVYRGSKRWYNRGMENKNNEIRKITELLPAGWEEKAKETGAITRSRKIKNAEDLLKLVLLYLTSGGSFGMTSAMLKLTEKISLNKNAVYERVKKSAEWLRWLCENICREALKLTEIPEWLKNKRVCLVDATDEAKKGSKNADYRLHYCVELFTLKTVEMQLTPASEGEKLSRFTEFRKDDIVVADRAYPSISGIVALEEKHADYVLRFRAKAFTLYDENHNRVEITDYLSPLNEGETADIQLFFKSDDGYRPIRVCAKRKTAESESNGINKLKASNTKKMRGAVSNLQAIYNRYIIIVTSLAPEIKTDCVLELYRARWQIELVFKRFKSLFDFDEMPSRSSEAIQAWFYGKLFIAFICERLVDQGRSFSPEEQF